MSENEPDKELLEPEEAEDLAKGDGESNVNEINDGTEPEKNDPEKANKREFLITHLTSWMLNEIFLRVRKRDRKNLRLTNSVLKNAIDLGPFFKRDFQATDANFDRMNPLPPFIYDLRLSKLTKTIPDNYVTSLFLKELFFYKLLSYENLSQLLVQATYIDDLQLQVLEITGNPELTPELQEKFQNIPFLRIKNFYFRQKLAKLDTIGDLLEFFAFKLPPFQLKYFRLYFLDILPLNSSTTPNNIIKIRSQSTDWFFPDLSFLDTFSGQIEKMKKSILKILKNSETTLTSLAISDFMEDPTLDLKQVKLSYLIYFQYLNGIISPLFTTMSSHTNLVYFFLSCNYTFWNQNKIEQKLSEWSKETLKTLQVTIFPEENSHALFYDLGFLHNFIKLETLAFLAPYSRKYIQGLPPSLTSLQIHTPVYPADIALNLAQLLPNLKTLDFIVL